MGKDPIVKSLVTGKEFLFNDYKEIRNHIPEEEYPITLIYEDEKPVYYNIACKVNRFWFEDSKEIKAGWMYKIEEI